MNKFSQFIGWLFLLGGIVLYIFPLIYDWFGFYSGLLAFIFIFIGITLLKRRKDQLAKQTLHK